MLGSLGPHTVHHSGPLCPVRALVVHAVGGFCKTSSANRSPPCDTFSNKNDKHNALLLHACRSVRAHVQLQCHCGEGDGGISVVDEDVCCALTMAAITWQPVMGTPSAALRARASTLGHGDLRARGTTRIARRRRQALARTNVLSRRGGRRHQSRSQCHRLGSSSNHNSMRRFCQIVS